MSRQVGGLLDLPHGVINGVLLPHVIRFIAEADPAPFATIAACLGLADDRTPAVEAAAALAGRVQRLATEVGVPRGLADLVVHDACMSTNPRPADETQMQALFWRRCDRRARTPRPREHPRSGRLTGVRSDKGTFHPEFRLIAQRLERVVAALDAISRVLVQTVHGPENLVRAVADAACIHLNADWVVLPLADGGLPEAARGT